MVRRFLMPAAVLSVLALVPWGQSLLAQLGKPESPAPALADKARAEGAKTEKGDPEKGPKQSGSDHLSGPFHFPPKITLSAQQQEQIKAIAATNAPRLEELKAAEEGVLSEQQRAAMKTARDKAHAAGLKGKEANDVVDRSVTITPQQRQQLDEIHARHKAVDEEIRAQIANVLTDEQKSALGGPYRPKGPPSGKRPKDQADSKPPAGEKGPPKRKEPKSETEGAAHVSPHEQILAELRAIRVLLERQASKN